MRQTLILFMSLSLFVSQSANGEEIIDIKKYTLNSSHLIFAKKINGETWSLLQKEHLTPEEKDTLLYSAFASAYHWSIAGTLIHKQRAEWLISRVYTRLGKGNSALFHAMKCMNITKQEGLSLKDFDYAYAHEALARSYALIEDYNSASKHYNRAKLAADNISREEDRQLFLSDLRDGNWNGYKREER